MDKKKVAEIRETLKKEFPEIKFSVTKERWSGVNINIMKAPKKYGFQEYENRSVNGYYIEEQFRKHEHVISVLKNVQTIANKILGVTYRETSDYGTQPNYYVWLGIGKWNQEFQVIGE
jgi:hypothetical protein